MLQVLVLGAAAGGGFPQWNSNNEASQRARPGDPLARPSSQSSVAVSGDGTNWVLPNASPDLRQQINDNARLHPCSGVRHSPLRAADPACAKSPLHASMQALATEESAKAEQDFLYRTRKAGEAQASKLPEPLS